MVLPCTAVVMVVFITAKQPTHTTMCVVEDEMNESVWRQREKERKADRQISFRRMIEHTDCWRVCVCVCVRLGKVICAVHRSIGQLANFCLFMHATRLAPSPPPPSAVLLLPFFHRYRSSSPSSYHHKHRHQNYAQCGRLQQLNRRSWRPIFSRAIVVVVVHGVDGK